MSTFLDNDAGATPKARPSLPRSNSTPSWTKNVSSESLSSTLTSPPPNVAPSALRKRHSTYVLSSSLDPSRTSVPILVPPPKRPVRNPARLAIPPLTVQTRTSPGNRPSNREEITPWEFVTPDDYRTPSESSSAISASKSRQLFSTGPVSEVTPWELYPVSRSATSGSTASPSFPTGTIEEVTPWELHPVPSVMPVRTTIPTGPIEEVTPWELAPAPLLTEPKPPIGGKQSSPRASTSTGQTRSFADIAHIRKRKKNGVGAQKSRSNTIPGAVLQKPLPPVSSGPQSIGPTPKRPHRVQSTPTSSKPALPSVPPFGMIAVDASDDTPSSSPKTNLKFSTADRTILEELKRNIKARESQFVLKGDESSLRRALGPQGKRHHPFPPDEVPYPRNYERNVIDLDIWETAFCREVCDGLTWHVFETPPTKILDVGCGSGTWILDCARSWKESHFVGLDIVPLQPELHQVGSSDLASRITWVHSNFLDGLPFPNDEFDFVHVKRIALGVPEDKWDFLFEEIFRVMKPGGAFEMLEEDLFFPGRFVDSDGDPEIDSKHSRSDTNLDTSAQSSSHSPVSHRSGGESPPTSMTTFSDAASRPNSPSQELIQDVDIQEEIAQKEEAQDLLAHVIGEYTTPSEQSSTENEVVADDAFTPSIIRQSLYAKTPPQRVRALSDLPTHSVYSRSTVSLTTNNTGSNAVREAISEPPKVRTRPRGISLSATLSAPVLDSHQVQNLSPMSPVSDKPPHAPPTAVDDSSGDLPSLVRTEPKAPIDPRDHSVLQSIYTQLLESRFINQHPLALLANSIGLYLKDVRTHPPLQYRFPAVPQKALEAQSVVKENGDVLETEDGTSDSDGARDAILPSPVSRISKKRISRRLSSQSYNGEMVEKISEDNRYVDVRSLLRRSTPYITLDVSRSSALSPSIKNMFPGVPGTKVQRSSFLPNTTMNIDLRSLNVHLALRVAEIMACSESMWEWVLQYQADAKAHKRARASVRSHRLGSGSVEMAPRISISSTSTRSSSDSSRIAILHLDRSGFDNLLRNFEMDMHDNYSLGSCLNERFSWFPIATEISSERERFEEACKVWDRWEQQQSTPGDSSTSVISHDDSAQTSQRLVSSDGIDELTARGDKTQFRNPSQLRPTHRMSRVMRVFVGWKPQHA